jgi:hypothetical protein
MQLEEIFRKKISKGRELLRRYKNPIIERDPQAQMVMKALALLASNHEYEIQNRVDNYTESFLDNYGMEFGRHPPLILGQTSGLQSRKITKGSSVYANGFLQVKYDHYHHNVTLDEVRSAGDLRIKIGIHNQDKIEKLRINCPPEVMSNIFGNRDNCSAFLEDSRGKKTCILRVDEYAWSDILYAPDFFSSFSVDLKNLEPGIQSIVLIISLKKQAHYPPEDFTLNQLILENSFIYPSDEIFIDGPGEYPVSLEGDLEFISTKKLTLDGEILSNIRDDPEGWYVTRKGEKLFLNIQRDLQGVCLLESKVSSKTFNPSDSYFQEENNCKIRLISGNRDPLFFAREQLGPLINSIRIKKLTPENLQTILGFYPEFCHWNLSFSREHKLYPGKIAGITIPQVKEQIQIHSNNSHCNLQTSIKNKLKDNYEIIWLGKN